MTNPTDTAEEAARAKLSWIESECPDFYDALILDVTTLLRERERAGIERAIAACEKDRDEADELSGNEKAIAYLTIDCCIENIRALAPKEGT